jgi:RND family efflux transporter MFP subunit
MKKKWIAAACVAVLAAGGGGFWAFKAKSGQADAKTAGADRAKPAASAASGAASASGSQAKGDEKKGPLLEFLPSDIGKAQLSTITQVSDASGALGAERSATVRSKQSAEVREITVREGESVRLGQIIAQLDIRELQERLRSAEGGLVAVEARLANAQRTRDSQKALLDQNFISATAFDSAEAAYKSVVGETSSARAQVALARQAMGDAVVRSPMSGVVAKRYVQPGEKLGFDSPVVMIMDPSSLELQAFVSPELASKVRPGQAVKVRITATSEKFDATIARVMPAVDSTTRQLGVAIRVPNRSGELKVGMDAVASISLGQKQVLTVPTGALHSASGEPYVWQLGSDNKVVRKKLQLGERDDTAGTIQVLSGIDQGAQVLIGRYDGLTESQQVVLKTAGQAAKPASPAASAAPAASAPKQS